MKAKPLLIDVDEAETALLSFVHNQGVKNAFYCARIFGEIFEEDAKGNAIINVNFFHDLEALSNRIKFFRMRVDEIKKEVHDFIISHP